jgi:hypothetical protein
MALLLWTGMPHLYKAQAFLASVQPMCPPRKVPPSAVVLRGMTSVHRRIFKLTRHQIIQPLGSLLYN